MCKILTIINTKQSNNKTIQDIIDANIDALKQEKCGFSIFRDYKTTFHLQGDYDNFAKLAKYKGENVFCIHSRTSTGGDSNQNGLHLQRSNGWFWAHNGMVGGFAGVKDFSDSYYFFMSLLSKLPIDAVNAPIPKSLIEKACQDLHFNGKGFLYNPKSKILEWFCNSPSWVTVFDGCIIITTYDLILDKEEYEYESMLGFEWISNTSTVTIPYLHQEKIDDCLLTFDRNNLIGRESIKLSNYQVYQQPYIHHTYDDSPVVYKGDINRFPNNLTRRERKALKRIENELKNDEAGLVDENGEYLVRNQNENND